ncbi:MAG: transcription elongation factor GreA [Armatimonadetes bacterium]|nr:transcription elongation factor GreA [Armatimonadota bacterium]
MDTEHRGTILTQQGYDDIRRELNRLLTIERPAVVLRLKEAMALGDLAENFDYHDAKRQQGLMEARIRDLKRILDTATVLEGNGPIEEIGVGSKVLVRDVADGFEDHYTIVGPPEADPSEGRISYESNMGAALLGRKAGERISVEAPCGVLEFEVVSIE